MSLQLMKTRIQSTGITPREEMIKDGQDLLREELIHDTSYSPTMYHYIYGEERHDGELGNLRIYGRKYSSLNGNYQKFLTSIDNPVKIGDTFHDTKNNTFWLVSESFNVDDIHYQGKMIQCNYLLRWQLPDGKIVERYANIVSASKYDVGESGGNTIVLSSNNFTILIPFCEDGLELEGKRVFIDKKDVNPTKVFKITRCDDVLYNYGEMGSLLSFIADKTELNADKDRPDLRICDYIEPTPPSPPAPPETDETAVLSASITGNTELKLGLSRTYTVTFTDKNDVEVTDVKFVWNVVADFDVDQVVEGNTVELYVEDDSLIGESFLLQVTVSNKVITEIEITVVEGL